GRLAGGTPRRHRLDGDGGNDGGWLVTLKRPRVMIPTRVTLLRSVANRRALSPQSDLPPVGALAGAEPVGRVVVIAAAPRALGVRLEDRVGDLRLGLLVARPAACPHAHAEHHPQPQYRLSQCHLFPSASLPDPWANTGTAGQNQPLSTWITRSASRLLSDRQRVALGAAG